MASPHLLAALGIALAVGAANPAPPARSSHPNPSHRPNRNAVLERGAFLIATRRVTGYFAESVLLLLDYESRGAFGVIVNRPSATPLARLLPGERAPEGRSDRIYRGGPVGIDSLAVLIRSTVPPAESTRIVADLHASFGAAALRRAIEGGVPANRIRAYLGHAGWAPGQLDAEVARGDWKVVQSSADLVFDRAPEKIWPRLIFEHGGLQVRFGGNRQYAIVQLQLPQPGVESPS